LVFIITVQTVFGFLPFYAAYPLGQRLDQSEIQKDRTKMSILVVFPPVYLPITGEQSHGEALQYPNGYWDMWWVRDDENWYAIWQD